MKDIAQPTGSVEEILHIYGNILFRMCLVMLGNASDADDAVQDTLLKYLQKSPQFHDAEHEKAWLLTVATNRCKDILRFKSRRRTVALDEIMEHTSETGDSGILSALMTLPEKYRTVLYLHYVEEYGTKQIAEMIQRTPSAVKMRLQKGRNMLKEVYRKEWM